MVRWFSADRVAGERKTESNEREKYHMDKTRSPVSFPDERMDTSTASEKFKSNNRRYKTRLKAYNEQGFYLVQFWKRELRINIW